MEENKNQFPTEEVTLPSKGLLYPENSPLSKGVIEIKYMTAREEDILTNQNYLKSGTAIDKLLQSLIITKVNYNDILLGDKNAILIAARILGYGADYEFKYGPDEELVSVDLSTLEDKEVNEDLITKGKNEFLFTLPFSKKDITFKLLSHGDDQKIQNEIKGLKKLNKNSSTDLTTRMKHMITSVGGNREMKSIREFVDIHLLARDARDLRLYLKDIQPDVDLYFNHEDESGEYKRVSIPINIGFFWPDVEL